MVAGPEDTVPGNGRWWSRPEGATSTEGV